MPKDVCLESFECKGSCWINVAGIYDDWEIVSNHCGGTKEEEERNDELFEGIISVDEYIKQCDYEFTEEEKKTLREKD